MINRSKDSFFTTDYTDFYRLFMEIVLSASSLMLFKGKHMTEELIL